MRISPGGADVDRGWRARPVALCAGLGLAAFVLAFFAALLVARGLTGGGLAVFVVPLALSGALAVGLGVAFVAAMAVSQPRGITNARRALAVTTPLALVLALYVAASEPADPVREPFVASVPAPAPTPPGPPGATGPRRVAVPPVAPVTVLGVRSEAPAPSRAPARAPARRPVTVALPPPRTSLPDPVDLVPRNTDRCWQAASGRNPHNLAPCAPKT